MRMPICSIGSPTFFPAILGRVCDVLASRLVGAAGWRTSRWRFVGSSGVAADLRGDIDHRLPQAPDEKNGKRVALIGAGCASLTVANDLAPLGYELVMYELLDKPGGLMRSNIPGIPPAGGSARRGNGPDSAHGH